MTYAMFEFQREHWRSAGSTSTLRVIVNGVIKLEFTGIYAEERERYELIAQRLGITCAEFRPGEPESPRFVRKTR